MMTQLQFEEVKNNLKYDLYELFNDYIDDIRITILNEDNIIIVINDIDNDTSNGMRMSKSDFNELEYKTFKKILNGLVFYAQ